VGSPRVITRPAAGNAVVWRWRLEGSAFGQHAAEGDPDGDGVEVEFGLRYPGQYYDSVTGWHYNYFRDYEAGTGRYLQSDPIGLGGGISTYSYVGSSPFLFRDEDGLYRRLFSEYSLEGVMCRSVGWLCKPKPLPPASFYGAEGHLIGGAGLTSVSCTDACGKKQTFRYLKLCGGGAAGASFSTGYVTNMSGPTCKSDTYAGWFFEVGGSVGPVSGGIDVGYTSTGSLSGVNEASLGGGFGARASATWCYYIPLQ
jgi:RHS repeat-associated protein